MGIGFAPREPRCGSVGYRLCAEGTPNSYRPARQKKPKLMKISPASVSVRPVRASRNGATKAPRESTQKPAKMIPRAVR